VAWRGMVWCGVVCCVIMLTFVLSSPDFMCQVKFFYVFHIVCSFLCLGHSVTFLSLQYIVLYTEIKIGRLLCNHILI